MLTDFVYIFYFKWIFLALSLLILVSLMESEFLHFEEQNFIQIENTLQ